MRALAVRVVVLLASAIATAAVLAAQQVVVATRDGDAEDDQRQNATDLLC